MNTGRKRGGRIPKLNPKSHHVMLRFDDDEWMKFLVMYEQTDVKAKAVFAKARIFGELQGAARGQDIGGILHQAFFFSLAVPNDWQQLQPGCQGTPLSFLREKAMALLYKLENCTRELVSLTREIVELTRKFEERWSQR